MKKILLAGVAAATMMAAGSAFAADLPSRKYAPVAPVVAAPVFTWTGFYVGVNAGYGWNTHKNDYGYLYVPGYAYLGYGSGNNDGGFVGGGQIGYNYQIGQFVVGAEADIQYADLKQKQWGYAGTGIEWFGTVRARAGVAIDRALLYVTGGFAYGGGGSDRGYYGYNDFYYRSNNSDTKAGWVLGGGLEYAFTDNLTAKVEGLYVSLEKNKNAWYIADDAWLAGVNKRNEFGVVRVGLNYKF
ncbi:outer membrane beta-barrel protein [Camelimonas abortus]|uniref:Outer membrane beta-barrel protein n=1 Tax=Camelimonas abortus TaxID=1017184 RepID=A0ABV7LC34_9HYPH